MIERHSGHDSRGVRGGFADLSGVFPLGLSEYGDATLKNVETLVTRLVNLSTKHVAELGQPFVDRFTTLKAAFTAARAAQLAAIGEVKGEKA